MTAFCPQVISIGDWHGSDAIPVREIQAATTPAWAGPSRMRVDVIDKIREHLGEQLVALRPASAGGQRESWIAWMI